MKNLPPKVTFKVKSFIPILDALCTDLNKIATVYNYAAEKSSFLAKLNSSVEQLNDAVIAIIQECPDNVDSNLFG